MEVRVGDFFSQSEIEAMREELKGGHSIEEVATRHGIPHEVIDRFLASKSKRGKKWTEKDLEFLRENYSDHGENWSGWKRLTNKGRTWGAICAKASAIGVNRMNSKSWTAEEVAFLAEHYSQYTLSWEGWKQLGRTKRAIRDKAAAEGLTRNIRFWTEEEDQFIIENYGKHDKDWEGWKQINRTKIAIDSRIDRIRKKGAEMNVVVISGNLTRDPELKSTTGGTSVLSFSMAVNDRRKNNQTGEWEDVPNYIDCVMFGRRADSLSKILAKGMKVTVNGKLSYSSWERDGQRRSKIEVVANDVELPPRAKGQQVQSQRQDDFYDDGIPF